MESQHLIVQPVCTDDHDRRYVGCLEVSSPRRDQLAVTGEHDCFGRIRWEIRRDLTTSVVLERLGPSGYLINVSRGSVVDEPALLDALENRTIAGAGMDVFASEPNLDPRWLRLENVVMQPHSTSITHETRAAMINRLTHDLDAYQNKRPFHNAAASSM